MFTPPLSGLSPQTGTPESTTSPPAAHATLQGRGVCVSAPDKEAVFSMPLPEDISLFVLSFLGVRDLVAARSVCRTWYHWLGDDPALNPIFQLLPVLNQRAPLTPEAQEAQTQLALQTTTLFTRSDCPRISVRMLHAKFVRNELDHHDHYPLHPALSTLIEKGNATHIVELLQLIKSPVKQCAWAQKSVLAFLDRRDVTAAARINNVFCKWSIPCPQDESRPLKYSVEGIVDAFSLINPKTLDTISELLMQGPSPACMYSLIHLFLCPAWESEAAWIDGGGYSLRIIDNQLVKWGLSRKWCERQSDKYVKATENPTVVPFYQNLLIRIDAGEALTIEDLVHKQMALKQCDLALFPTLPYTDHAPAATLATTLLDNLKKISCSDRSKLLFLADSMQTLIYCAPANDDAQLVPLMRLIEEAEKYVDPSDHLNPAQLKPLVYFLADWMAYCGGHETSRSLAHQLLARYGWTSSDRDESLVRAIGLLKQFQGSVYGFKTLSGDPVVLSGEEFPPPMDGPDGSLPSEKDSQ